MANDRKGTIVRLVHTVFTAGTAVGQSDGQLLAQFATGEENTAELAFSALVERHGPMVLRVCRSILRNKHDAQDAFQATFLVLARKAGSLWARDSLGPWLYGVAFRTALCARSCEIVRRRHEQMASESATRGVLAEENRDDLGRVLHEEIGTLPERYRTPILLCYFEGLSHDQAARQLNWPVGTVRSRLTRARERLRSRLARRGITSEGAYLHVISFRLGSLPPYLIDSTVKAAMLLAARDAGTVGLVSASVVALTEGVLRTMLVSKLRMTTAILLAVGAITSGVGLYAYQDLEPGAASGSPTRAPVKVDGGSLNSADLDAYAARVELLVRRARQEQAQGDLDGAVRDLRKSESIAGEWREALMNRRRIEKRDLPSIPPTPIVNTPGSSDRRLDALERKVDRILHALEKEGRAIAPAPPPRVEGEIKKIDSQTKRVELNMGLDDGLIVGHELIVYRKAQSPRSREDQYLGRLRIVSVDPDNATAKVIENPDGKKIKEGDSVSTELPAGVMKP
jgi:RNA polymerase sigma factor (sigma-70 family)